MRNDPDALHVATVAGKWMGRGLALLIDALNPQVIVFGSLGVALGERILGPARKVIAEEALPQAAAACELCRRFWGNEIGDVAALMAALDRTFDCGALDELGKIGDDPAKTAVTSSTLHDRDRRVVLLSVTNTWS